MTREYVVWTEENDNEGETWRFYIPLKGNEDAVADLYYLTQIYRETVGEWDAAYDLEPNVVLENAVDDRVSLGDGDYMPAHNKLSGKLKLPSRSGNVNPETPIYEWFDDNFYKGGIKDYVK